MDSDERKRDRFAEGLNKELQGIITIPSHSYRSLVDRALLVEDTLQEIRTELAKKGRLEVSASTSVLARDPQPFYPRIDATIGASRYGFKTLDRREGSLVMADVSLGVGGSRLRPDEIQYHLGKRPMTSEMTVSDRRETLICYYCHHPGHKIAGCFQKKWDEEHKEKYDA